MVKETVVKDTIESSVLVLGLSIDGSYRLEIFDCVNIKK